MVQAAFNSKMDYSLSENGPPKENLRRRATSTGQSTGRGAFRDPVVAGHAELEAQPRLLRAMRASVELEPRRAEASRGEHVRP